MDDRTFLTEFARLLEIAPSDISMSTRLSSLKNWDSLNVLGFMSFVDEKFGGEISPDAIAAAETIMDLYRLASAQGAPAAE